MNARKHKTETQLKREQRQGHHSKSTNEVEAIQNPEYSKSTRGSKRLKLSIFIPEDNKQKHKSKAPKAPKMEKDNIPFEEINNPWNSPFKLDDVDEVDKAFAGFVLEKNDSSKPAASSNFTGFFSPESPIKAPPIAVPELKNRRK